MTFLFRRRFLPLFVAQFVGALSDTLYKNALAVLIIYRLPGALGLAPSVLVSLAAGLFILPFVLFSAAAGAWADRHEKSGLILRIKGAEIGVAAAAALALSLKNPLALLAVLALFGCLATAFGPLKYAILPDYLAPGELLAGNAWVEAGTFVAILLGMIGGIWADKFDHMAAVTNFIVTPLSFLSGTFYSIDHLPPSLKLFALVNPFFYMIDGFRAGFIGHADSSIGLGIAVVGLVNLALSLLAYRMFKTGYKLKA